MYSGQNLPEQWFKLLVESHGILVLLIINKFRNWILLLDDLLLCEYTDRINNDLLLIINDETKNLYKHVFHRMQKAIQPLDYFSNELILYVQILIHLSQWPALVRVD